MNGCSRCLSGLAVVLLGVVGLARADEFFLADELFELKVCLENREL